MTSAFEPRTDPFRLNPRYRLQWEEAQGCHVLLYPEGLVKLNDTAAAILGRSREPVDIDILIERLRLDYPEADSSLADDVAEFLDHARQRDWIVPAGD